MSFCKELNSGSRHYSHDRRQSNADEKKKRRKKKTEQAFNEALALLIFDWFSLKQIYIILV